MLLVEVKGRGREYIGSGKSWGNGSESVVTSKRNLHGAWRGTDLPSEVRYRSGYIGRL